MKISYSMQKCVTDTHFAMKLRTIGVFKKASGKLASLLSVFPEDVQKMFREEA